jgi:hypothetical protein
MIVGTGKLLDWFTYNDKPFWIIRRSEKSDMIARSPENEVDLDTVRSKELLQSTLSILSPEVYYIQTWSGTNPQSTTGAKTCVHFRLTDGESRNNNQQPVISGIDPQTFDSKVESEVQKRMDIFTKEQALLSRIGKLEEQLKEDSGSGFWDKSDRVMDRVERWLPNFIPEFKTKINVGNIKQVNKEDITEMKQENIERVENTLAVFQADLGEDKTVELLEKLGSICQNDNDTFKFLIKKLG